MRTDTAILQARARKDRTVQHLLDNISTVTDDEIDAAPIKPGDRKLLKRARPQLERLRASQQVESMALEMAKAMPIHDTPEQQFDMYLYLGDPFIYGGLEIDTGTVVSYTDDWVRFDFNRIKRSDPIDQLLARCQFQCRKNINGANDHIHAHIQQRHAGSPGVSATPGESKVAIRSFW